MTVQHLINRSNHTSGMVFNATCYYYAHLTTEKSTVVGLLNVMHLFFFDQIAQKTITADSVKFQQQYLNLKVYFLSIKRLFIRKTTSFWQKCNTFCHFFYPHLDIKFCHAVKITWNIYSFILQAKNRVKWDEEKSHTVKMTEAMYLKMVILSFYTFFYKKLSTLRHGTYRATNKFLSEQFYPQNWTL